jgi:PAS domain S-box-containing protein
MRDQHTTSDIFTAIRDEFVTSDVTQLPRQVLKKLPAYMCDVEGYINLFNNAAVSLWGRRPDLGRDRWCGSLKIYDQNGDPLALENCPVARTIKESKPNVAEEIIIERQNGERVNVLTHSRPVFDENGAIIGAANILLDVTSVRSSASKTLDDVGQFKALAEHAPMMIWMADKYGNCIFVNQQWKMVTGQENPTTMLESWQNLAYPSERGSISREWKSCLTSKKPYMVEHRLLNKDQEYIIVRVNATPMRNGSGDFVGFIGIVEDITLHKNSIAVLENEIQKRTNDLLTRNEELRRSEERYQKMIEEVQDYAIILLDAKGTVQNWNKGAQEIKGYTADEAIGMDFRKFYTEEDQHAKLPERLIDIAIQEGRARHEGWRVRKDGTTFWGNVVITTLHDSQNNVIGFSKVTRDLTERKLAEEAAQQNHEAINHKARELERMNQELASFAYVSSHDLQEPLRKIQTFASRIMETETNLSEKGRDYFGRMQNAAFRMQTLIEDLLAYSRTNTSEKKFEHADLNKLLDEVKNELKEQIEEKDVVIESAALPTMEVIVFQFRQLLTNILSNAIKFSKAGVSPHIKIFYEVKRAGELNIEGVDQKILYHHFSIADNGIGFEPEHSQKIFEVFQRLHGRSEYSGTGIGLAICKKIAENHDGLIRAESDLGKGATFHFYIPVIRKKN